MNELFYKCLPSYINIVDTPRMVKCIILLGMDLSIRSVRSIFFRGQRRV